MNLDPELEGNIVAENRLGRFDVTEMLIRRNPSWMLTNVYPYMLVVRMEPSISSDPNIRTFRVVAYSPVFERLSPGDEVPQYRIDFGDGPPRAERIDKATEHEKELSHLRNEVRTLKEKVADLGANLRTMCAAVEHSVSPEILASGIEALAKAGMLV